VASLSLEQLMEAVGAWVQREMQTYALQATLVDQQQQLPVSLGKLYLAWLPLHAGYHSATGQLYCAGSVQYI
jgi:hypothetical protein